MISLKSARVNDYWRRALMRESSSRIESVLITGDCFLDHLLLTFPKGISAIVGKNGAGKSNIVKILHNTLRSENSNQGRISTPLYLVGTTRLKGIVAGTPLECDVPAIQSLNDIWHEKEVTSLLYNPCSLIPSIQAIVKQENLDEYLDGFGSIILDKEELQMLAYLTGCNYSSVTVHSIEDEYDDWPILPFFTVQTEHARYDSRFMGLGELSLFYFFWLVVHISKLEGEKILLIEEPESFIPPINQVRLTNLLAYLAGEKGIQVIISSHSEHILAKIPRANISIIRNVGGLVTSRPANDAQEPLSVLGLTAPKRGLLFYEDIAASFVIKAMLKVSKLLVPDSFFYHKSGSDGDIWTDLSRFPSDIRGFKFIAIFDGDCRSTYKLKIPERKFACFLPGDLPPEVTIFNYCKTLSVDVYSAVLNTSIERIQLAIDNANGLDHHDYFYSFAETLGCNFDFIFQSVSDAWAMDDINSQMVNLFLTELEAVIR